MQETVRELAREVKLQQLVIDAYVPDQYQQLINSHATWNEDTGEWHLVSCPHLMQASLHNTHTQRGLAYAGNNVPRPPTPPDQQVSLPLTQRSTFHSITCRNWNGTLEWPTSPITSEGSKFTHSPVRLSETEGSEFAEQRQLFIRCHGD